MPSIELADRRVYYREAGTRRPPVLLIHGAGAYSASFEVLLRTIGRKCWTLAPDLPGHGTSQPYLQPPAPEQLLAAYSETLALFAERVGLGRFTLVGHSMGAAVAQCFALAYPERLSALVLLGGGVRALRRGWFCDVADFAADALMQVYSRVAYSAATQPHQAEAWTRRHFWAAPSVTRADFEACAAFDLRARLGQIRCQTAIVAGADDRIAVPAGARELRQHIAGSAEDRHASRMPRLHVLSRAGHQLQQERPDRVAAIVLQMVADQAGAI